jgi:DNA-binding NarL/FixJ family response regulator
MHDAQAGFLQQAYEAGAFHYFSKTSSRKEILAAIYEARPRQPATS